MGGHGTEVEVRSTNQIKGGGIYSNKKKNNEKFGKTQKKLPDLASNGQFEGQTRKQHPGGFASDSDEYLNNQQLPMIKGGGSIHAHNVSDAYPLNNLNPGYNHGGMMGPAMGKGIKKNVNNSNLNQSKYISGNVSHHNQSQSPAS